MLIEKYGIENLTNKPHGGKHCSGKHHSSSIAYPSSINLPLDEETANQELSAKDAGKILGVSGKTTIRMMRDGDFPGYDIGLSGFKFKRGDIEAYLESRKVQGKKTEEAA